MGECLKKVLCLLPIDLMSLETSSQSAGLRLLCAIAFRPQTQLPNCYSTSSLEPFLCHQSIAKVKILIIRIFYQLQALNSFIEFV